MMATPLRPLLSKWKGMKKAFMPMATTRLPTKDAR